MSWLAWVFTQEPAVESAGQQLQRGATGERRLQCGAAVTTTTVLVY